MQTSASGINITGEQLLGAYYMSGRGWVCHLLWDGEYYYLHCVDAETEAQMPGTQNLFDTTFYDFNRWQIASHCLLVKNSGCCCKNFMSCNGGTSFD